ncbi:MAG TPA: DNA polymerase/3'-5' exonuclease PolX [Candidatus Nanoarchaeia archaeon]|nr:DNA polymerase/3'-5' exonuclease PolX [Candidatus Nanoarchaeia archaeon]
MGANRDFAALLYEMADILDMRKVQWKPQAYRKAARSLEGMERDIAQIYQDAGRRGLLEVPGIGESIADHIVEWLKTGKVQKFEGWRAAAPKGAAQLLQIEGLGPQKIKFLSEKLGIDSIKKLQAAAKKGKLRDLEGFGLRTEQNILQAVAAHSRYQGRLPLGIVLPIAEDIIHYLKQKTKLKTIEYGGSLRRMRDTIGDIDILAGTQDPKTLMQAFTGMPDVARILASGATKSTVVLRQGIQVDIRALPEESYGAAFVYFTGSKDHNIQLRNIAIQKGYKLSEYGLFRKRDGKLVPAPDENAIYRRLGLLYIPPELREARGEIEAAQRGKLPSLLAQEDIRGDLHIHTTFSDGAIPVDGMVKAAKDLGYEYIAITDHSPNVAVVHGLGIEELHAQWKEIDRAAERHDIIVLKGAEVDILKNGRLDYPEEILKQLAITVCSVHTFFKMPEKEMTERICTALQNPYLDIWGHPSARRIGIREPITVNWKKVFRTAADHGKVLEINSQIPRMDLHDAHILAAKAEGAKFCIDTDSHSIAQLTALRYGIGQARRGWLGKDDVVNTLPLTQLRKIFSRIPETV